MTNGSGLKGDLSSTTSALIVPQPNVPDKYIVFTVDEPHHFNADDDPATVDSDGVNDGFRYSVVDMTLDDGLGAVIDTQKNIPLITYDTTNPQQSAYKCSEKITAVKSETCNSFWVITHFIDTFYAFEVNQTGVIETPVKSKIGVTVPVSGYRRNALGYLKASPVGDKLALAHLGYATETGGNAPGGIAIYDFDNVTGSVSNETILYNGDAPYGIEFSQSGNKLYATVGLGDEGIEDGFIMQYDLALPINQVAASGTRLPNENGQTTSTFSAGALQLGPDGKIYRALFNFDTSEGDYLGVVENPEAAAADVVYRDRGILVNTDGRRASQIGLPPFIQSIFAQSIDIINNGDSTNKNLTLCEGQLYRLSYQIIPGATYQWFVNDTITTNTSPFFEVTQPGNYRLEVDLNDGSCPAIGVANVSVVSNPNVKDAILLQCDSTPPFDDQITLFNLQQSVDAITDEKEQVDVSFYTDPADATNQLNAINNTTSYQNTPGETVFVRVENNSSGCFSLATLELQTSSTSANDIVWGVCDEDGTPDGFVTITLADTETALVEGIPGSGFQFSFYTSVDDALAENNKIDTYRNLVPYTQGTEILHARIEDENNDCFGIQSIILFINPIPTIETDASAIVCENETTFIDSGVVTSGQNSNDFEYLWSNGETTEAIEVKEPGEYSVSIIDKLTGCSTDRLVRVSVSNLATIDKITVKDAQKKNTVTIEVSGLGIYEYAIEVEGILSEFQDENTFFEVPPGIHRIFINDKNGCGQVISDFFSVIGFPDYFTPNGDTFHETWNVEGVNDMATSVILIRIFDRNGKLLKQITPDSSGWDGTYNNQLMPSGEYWFKATITDARVVTGSFSLIR